MSKGACDLLVACIKLMACFLASEAAMWVHYVAVGGSWSEYPAVFPRSGFYLLMIVLLKKECFAGRKKNNSFIQVQTDNQ